MNHLVQDGVLYHFFRHIDPHVDTQHKILISERPEQPLPLPHKRHFAQEALSWVLDQPGVTSVLVGASSVEQLANNIRL